MTPPRLTGATLVDHATPLQDGGSQYDMNNLQSLCRRCHQIKTNLETRQRHGAKYNRISI